MNPAQLFSHFDRISEAPDAIPHLRRFILDLAVRGKLVEQDPKDEPASKLLKRILAENHQVEDAIDPLAEEEQSFEIPQSWAWIRIGNAAHVEMGQSPPSENYNQSGNGIPFYQGKTDFGVRCPTPRYWCNLPSKLAQKNDVLISVRAPVGPTNVASEECCIGRGLAGLRPRNGVYLEFLLYSLKGFEPAIAAMGYGATFVAITKKQLVSFALPLPPLAEQHRIVAKVEELMALCDRLDAAQEERESRRNRLAAASLHRLNNGADADAFRDQAHFHLRHLSRLTTRTEHIQQLRQTILNLAIRGKLIPTLNWPQQPKLLGEAASLQNGYAFKSEWFASTGIRLLRNANVSHGVLRWDDLACLPTKRADEFERFQLNEGDVVLSLDRPFILTGTKVACVRPQDMPCLLLQRVGRFQLDVERICSDYLFLWLHSPHFARQINPGRSNGVPHISSKQVEAAEIFLPPLAEQHRIVAKVDELMRLCDELEANLTMTATARRQLLEATLHEALTPALEKIA